MQRNRPLRSEKLTTSTSLAAEAAARDGSAAGRFWIACQEEAVFALYTPFMVCLAAGKLGLDVFRNYIAQNARLLKAFAQAYQMAEGYADDDESKAVFKQLRISVLKRLTMNDSVSREWGIATRQEVIPNSATLKYTEFLLETAAGKIEGGKGSLLIDTPFEKTRITAYTVGAMTPFTRLVAYLAKELHFHLKHKGNDHPCKKWIDIYASASFEASAVQIEQLLDKLSVSLTSEELAIVEKLYRQAMKHEIEFYSSLPIVQPALVPLMKVHDLTHHLVIFSDFDLTCTVIDSSATLAEISISISSRASPSGTDDDNQNAQVSSSDVRSAWDAIAKLYTEEFGQCIKSIVPSEQDAAKTLDYESLYNKLEQISVFEKRANSRVIESGLLKGISLEDIKRVGELLVLQDGCKDFFQESVKMKEKFNADFHILSCCWCADLMRSAFSSVGCLNALNIHSNEFIYEESISTGEFVRTIESPTDNVETFRNILANLGSSKQPLSVFIGDSIGDLLCLLEADVGIIIGSNSSLRKVGEQFGVSFVPLYSGLIKKQSEVAGEDSLVWKGLSGVLYTASSWTEIHAFLFGA
ncbi:hypothetical protein ZIOFF_029937 [Zingiber officinale]|uniref:Thiaminase-2/PQQC domain-containing protein n=1 Tax=Zingiber officinale TaxID=94328 RepID=A0A8J5LB92_ZINOF|nr:hypothetical protein ZIOFF_029937 [Zingiber officinale]